MTLRSQPAEPMSDLAAVLDDAASLLAQFSMPDTHGKGVGSTLVRHRTKRFLASRAVGGEPIRSIHHFAFTGGRLIGRLLQALPNVTPVCVSGAHEAVASPSRGASDDPVSSELEAIGIEAGLSAQDAVDEFRASTRALYHHSVATGRYLVLVDNAQERFCSGLSIVERPMLRERLPAGIPLRSIIMVREPLDSFASLAKSAAMQSSPPSLSEYANRYLQFLDLHAELPRIRYEDLVKDPQGTMRKVAELLELPAPAAALLLEDSIAGPGSGGDLQAMQLRPRSAEATARSAEALRSESMTRLYAALGYRLEPPPPAVAANGLSTAERDPASQGTESLIRDIQRQLTELGKLAMKQNSDLFKVSEHLQAVVRKELLNAVRQLEAYAGVQAALAGGDLLPEMHGWPISPDFAAYLVELIRANDYDAVIEFGSGTSTVLVARLLAQESTRRTKEGAVLQLAFEHLPLFHAQTSAQLRGAGLEKSASVVLTPLVPYEAPNGKGYLYYDCASALAEVGRAVSDSARRVLVIVDGPPSGTGEHARYPALPRVMGMLRQCAVDFLLDDYIREDEQQVARMWQDELAAAGRTFEVITRKLDKDACLIRIQAEGKDTYRYDGPGAAPSQSAQV